MYLKEFSIDRLNWRLNDIHFGAVNLIVGPNAVGKTKTLLYLQQISAQIIGKQPFFKTGSTSVDLKFDDNGVELEYAFKIEKGIVVSEVFKASGEIVIMRTADYARLVNEEINPPQDRLIVQIRRDTEKYPNVEKLIQFMENLSVFSFSSIHPEADVLTPIMVGDDRNVSEMFASLKPSQRREVVKHLNELDFKVDGLESMPLGGENQSLLVMKESGVKMRFVMSAFSTGLIRVIAILSYLLGLTSRSGGGLVMIDDLGEGLDYFRSTQLGKLICDYCRRKKIQLILTTNDSFLMNVIDIDNWIILQREGSVVSSICAKTHPELFNKFKKTGLSNYDLFKSDFVKNNLERP